MNSTMLTISLETSSGEFVGNAVIPPFDPVPEIVIWGERVFRLYLGNIYREAFTYWIREGETHEA